ncbi:tetratricopeptide repeat protein 28-like [Stylophora pistillata]|uniref:tetratricopeptide repeat protein 28-like n=1 Tax=Stylophora pistillata TaxID=50429 RepID=UPI000C0440BC|nr:tetratricopeptide repeat protein 28-like [Stylophora pistillata]
MQSQEASSLLALISGISDSELGEAVAKELDNQPLALASAATYVKQLRQSKRFSEFGWNDFLKKVEKGQRDATETLLAEINPCYKKSMTTAITLAVREAMESDRIIDHALTFLSLCASQPLNEDIVVNYIVNVVEGIKDKEMIIMKLQRCSLLLSHEDEFGVHIRIHQVVHDVVTSLIQGYLESRHVKNLNSAVAAFNQFIDINLPNETSGSILKSYALSLHLRCFILNFDNVLSEVALSRIVQPKMEKLGEICFDHCHFQAAKKCDEFLLQAALKKFGTEYTNVAYYYNRLGQVNRKELGDFEKAKEYYELALSIQLKKLGPEHELGDFEKAKEYHELALSSNLKTLGPEHVEVASSYSNLGSVHKKLGDFEKAKENWVTLRRLRSITLKKLGPEHVRVASSYSKLGSVHEELGDFEKAKEYYELALSIQLKKLGPEHVRVASSYSKLGSVHEELGDFEKAKEYYELALSIQLKKLGPEHVRVASSYSKLGSVHEELGDFEKAKEYHELALSIKEKKLGPEHVRVASSYSKLGSVHEELGDFEKAKEYHELALSIKEKKLGPEHLGPEHVRVAASYSKLGSVHNELGDFEKAKEYHELALSIALKELGPEHVSVATCYNNLGSIHEELGDFEKAKEYHELALSIA